ncbi:hypothetical protein QOZ80_9BG0699640 [Eleusine coracana subsp. coracana]|nr:hypothetical protein QOZ80_9BG0699640 [Eleusine coracana subsp. coracana]
MAAIGGGTTLPSGNHPGLRSEDRDHGVEEMLQGLRLTAEEEEVAELSDDEDAGLEASEMALIRKILSPITLNATTILSTMKPAWGNPFGLKIRSVGGKAENFFVVEFGDHQAMKRALGGSPWLVGKYAVILQPYDGSLKSAEIKFVAMEIWVRILTFPWVG